LVKPSFLEAFEMQRHRDDKIGVRQSPTGISDFQQFNQGRRPLNLSPKLELMDTGANDSFMKYGRSGRVKMEDGLDAFAAQMIRRVG
jgi:hypothetical protein